MNTLGFESMGFKALQRGLSFEAYDAAYSQSQGETTDRACDVPPWLAHARTRCLNLKTRLKRLLVGQHSTQDSLGI